LPELPRGPRCSARPQGTRERAKRPGGNRTPAEEGACVWCPSESQWFFTD